MLKRLLLSPEGAAGGGGSTAAPAAPAPSSTPSTAPASPAVSAPAKTSPQSSTQQDSPDASDPFAAADAKWTERRAKARAEADAKAKAAQEPSKKPDAQPDPSAEPAADPNKDARTLQAKDPKALRQQYDKINGELAASRKEAAELQAKIKDYESRNKDTTALSEQLANAQKERESLQAEIRALKQEVSPEFKQKFEKPFNDAANYAKGQIEQLIINDNGGVRQATWNDFAALYNQPLNKAAALAKEQFGESAPEVMAHIRDLKKLEFQKTQALAEEKAQWKDRESKATAEQAQRQEAIKSSWTKVNADLVEKNPDYQEDPKDEEANTARREGYALFDAQAATLSQRMVKDAHIRHRTAAYPVLKLQVSRLTDKVAELEAALKEAKESGPGPTLKRGGGDGGSSKPESWKDDLRKTLGE